MPALLMAPVVLSTNGWPVTGSLLGTIKGFTQRGCTGIMLPATLAELEELNTSAVAVALVVVFEKLPLVLESMEKMGAKKIGSLALVTVTVTTGLTAKEAPAVLQSVLEAPALPAPYSTDTFALETAAPLIRFC